jgi:hypothetical protein
MRARRVFSLRFITFALAPLCVLLLTAEAAARLKCFSHGHSWLCLTTPFPLNARTSAERWMPPQEQAAIQNRGAAPFPAPQREQTPPTPQPTAPQTGPEHAPSPADASPSARPPTESAPRLRAAAETVPATAPPSTSAPAPPPHAPPAPTSPQNQMVFNWPKPCVDQTVYSTEQHRQMPRTWDDNCFRGDRVAQHKDANEYRIVFLGGSTVEDAQSDDEMMTAQFKHALPPTHRDKRVSVVNAGKAGFESRRILLYWQSWVHTFSPDVVLYYEAWNEQPTDVKFARADARIAAIHNWLHGTLYHRSMLYTYLVEKFAFLTAANDHFWKIDVNELRRHFTALASDVRGRGARFVFVTQVVRFPRTWKGVDTFDYRAVAALLDRLKADRQYAYDVQEISALNQRLAVLYTLKLCRENDIPVINILDAIEARGDAGRAEMFADLGHLTVKGDKIVGELIGTQLNTWD